MVTRRRISHNDETKRTDKCVQGGVLLSCDPEEGDGDNFTPPNVTESQAVNQSVNHE